jgi:hypothetical protein
MLSKKVKYWLQRKTRGWSDDETWNLDYEFIKWINTRFKKYKELATEIVDLEEYKFKYNGKTYTQLQIIDRIIEITDYMIKNDYFEITWSEDGYLNDLKNEMFDLLKAVFPAMWW